MPVIACARQLGSRGDELAQHIAQAMNLRFIDREVIGRAALAAGVSEEALEATDERRPSLLERITTLLSRYPVGDPLGNYSIQEPETLEILSPETESRMLQEVVTDLARQGDCLLIGHGAPYFLRRAPGVLSVYFCASKQFRLDWIMANEHVDKGTAERRMRDSDQQRKEYTKNFWQLEWANPAAYDLCINTDWYDEEGALHVVLEALRGLKR
jgi:cytidylate kinase